MMTSAAETPSPSWMPTGMPRPLSVTLTELSACSTTLDIGMPAAQRLVDAVIDDLVDHMVQARAIVGIADIHPRPLAHRFQALENLDGIGAVFFGDAERFGHAVRGPCQWWRSLAGCNRNVTNADANGGAFSACVQHVI